MHRTALFVITILAAFAAFAFSVLTPGVSAEELTSGVSSSGAAADEFVAFYFHGNVRCATCRKIEAYARESIAQGFVDELDSGRLAWRVINIEEPGNEHFIEDFQLVTRSVVLVEYRAGEVVRWKNLDRVWQLVRDKERFVSYVQDGTKAFLESG
jgi:hypothetical protein